jgi:hypothetical protein
MLYVSGLRSIEVAFPPHDSSDAGLNPAEVVEFLRTEKFREQSSGRDFKLFDPCSKFTAPRGPLSKIIGHIPSKSFGRGLAMS